MAIFRKPGRLGVSGNLVIFAKGFLQNQRNGTRIRNRIKINFGFFCDFLEISAELAEWWLPESEKIETVNLGITCTRRVSPLAFETDLR